uniref:hypothetical protein n=1 Tax=Geobacillus sp. (strain Y412MC10) TaxID=481743 RepID=UPI0037C8A048
TGTRWSGNCSRRKYRQYEDRSVDDGYVGGVNIECGGFEASVVAGGVKEEDLKVFYELVSAADASWKGIL